MAKGTDLPLLTSDTAAQLGGPEWLVARREAGAATFEKIGMPNARDEVWRYSPIGDLDLDRFSLAQENITLGETSLEAFSNFSGTVVHVAATGIEIPTGSPNGITLVKGSEYGEASELFGSVANDTDAMVALNSAHVRDPLIVDVAKGSLNDEPVVIVHHASSGSMFPRTIIRLADGAVASVIEIFVGGDADTLSIPVTEIEAGDGANLRYGSLQLLNRVGWHLSTISARVGRDANVMQFTTGLGAAYDRCRSDVELAGQGASSVLRSTYFGSGDQIHDLRTQQDHVAPKTISDLLCKGAVTGSSRSVYTGMIKVRNGAIRSNAMQTNHNLVLSETAHADTVPNLDISENDVRCSHASTVGPLDEDQRYYLESRGISPVNTERLLVRGFFRDLLEKTPLPLGTAIAQEEIEARLSQESLV